VNQLFKTTEPTPLSKVPYDLTNKPILICCQPRRMLLLTLKKSNME
jgi:hypothetical protein